MRRRRVRVEYRCRSRWKALSPARNIARHEDGCTEFSQRPGEGKHSAGNDAADGQREGNGHEDPEWRSSQRRGHLFETGADGFKGDASAPHEQGERHERHCNHDGTPGKYQLDIKMVMEKTADVSLAPQKLEQN
jgi:hypothetical protein